MQRDAPLADRPSPMIEEEEEFGPSKSYASLADIFDLENRDSSLYRRYFTAQLESLAAQGVKLGALMMEPVLLGAGGMLFV